MQLRIQAFFIATDVQDTIAFLSSVHLHRHLGIEGTVVLRQLLLAFRVFVDARHMRTGDVVHASIRQDYSGAGSRCVHFRGGRIAYFLAFLGAVIGHPGLITFIYVVENHCRGHRTGNVCIVQNQGHDSLRIGLCFLSKINGHLPCREFSGQAIRPCRVDVQHGVRCCFLGAMFLRIFTFAVRVAALIGIAVLIIQDVVGNIHIRFLIF